MAKVQTTSPEYIIMGIDPGTIVMGYGIIQCRGKEVKLLAVGSIHFDSKEDHLLRVKKILNRLESMLEEFTPDYVAIEAQFFGKNIQSMLKLGRAQGVCIAAALQRDIPVIEYAPKKIKQSVTGNGNASKEQVKSMLQRICAFEESPKFLDATDALAIAFCHYYQLQAGIVPGKSKTNSWESFIKQNPGRIK